MVRGEGAYCWDADGNRFIDWAMGNRVICLGHAHPKVNDAVKRAIDQGTNFTRPGVLELEAAEVFVDLIPWAEMVKFGKNGSDVTSAAVRLARAATGRTYMHERAAPVLQRARLVHRRDGYERGGSARDWRADHRLRLQRPRQCRPAVRGVPGPDRRVHLGAGEERPPVARLSGGPSRGVRSATVR